MTGLHLIATRDETTLDAENRARRRWFEGVKHRLVDRGEQKNEQPIFIPRLPVLSIRGKRK